MELMRVCYAYFAHKSTLKKTPIKLDFLLTRAVPPPRPNTPFFQYKIVLTHKLQQPIPIFF